MGAEHTVFFGVDDIGAAVRGIAADVDRDFDDGLVVLVVMKGAVVFATDLVRAMTTDTELAFVTASSYESFTPGEELTVSGDIGVDLSGRDVLLVDDIIDTGRTLRTLVALVESEGAHRVATAALVNKTQRRSPDSAATYTGIDITDEFIYGYGLDWDERFRDLPFIALAGP